MVLNEKDFKEIIKPIKDINKRLHECKALFEEHIEKVIGVATREEGCEFSQTQENIYLVECERIDEKLGDFLNCITEGQEKLKNVADKILGTVTKEVDIND